MPWQLERAAWSKKEVQPAWGTLKDIKRKNEIIYCSPFLLYSI